MKRNTCLLLVLILPLLGISQGVKTNLFDQFLKKQRIETEPVVVSGLSGNNRLSIHFSAIASSLYLNLSGAGWGASTIDRDNELVLLFSNDSSLSLRSAALQSFEPGAMQNIYHHQYAVNFKDLDLLSRYDMVGLRKYSFTSYSDLSLPKENAGEIRKLSAVFQTAVKNANLVSGIRQINVRDVRNYIGDSVTFCSKVYRTRYFQGSEDGPTLLDVQANFSDPFVNVVILEKDRSKFDGAPENSFLNKDVCISGVVRLRNNLPYLVIRNREQIRVSTPAQAKEDALPPAFTSAKEGADTKKGEGLLTETLAEFPGGAAAFQAYLEKNNINPVMTTESGSRQVIASFEIDAQGTCSGIKIVGSPGAAWEETIRKALQNMPKWKPAFSNGRFVATRITQPMTIKNNLQ